VSLARDIYNYAKNTPFVSHTNPQPTLQAILRLKKGNKKKGKKII
jgi:hypothetical protein